MTYILKLFSLNTLREWIAKVSLGAEMWNLVKFIVQRVEIENPEIPGEEKFRLAAARIYAAAKDAAPALAKRALNEAIEFAVRLLKG